MLRNTPNLLSACTKPGVECEGKTLSELKKSFNTTIRVPLEALRRVHREIKMVGDELYAKTGLKRNEKLLSLDVKFENGYFAELNAYPGEGQDPGFVEVILLDAEGNERVWDTDYEDVLGLFSLFADDMAFSINVMPEEKYVLVNRSVYDAEADYDIVETMAVDADWLAYYLRQSEDAPKDTLWGFLEEYTTEDVNAWYGAALLEGAIVFSFSMPGPALRFEWAMDDGWKAEALLETMDKFGFTSRQILDCLRSEKEGAK